jgi:4-amino-4-deoxy-L-arabinose transferase-like glycosyltransferase
MKKIDISGILKNKYFWIMIAITLVGFFFRAYKHEKLLFFEVDQARDWRIVEIAQQYGIGELPLLGPGMNASSFRIGPIYHYIQYLAAIFGNSPNSISYPDLLFSVLTIPLFYFFLKEFFGRKISALLSLLLACSLFAIEYGRFAMNSNSIPFFSLLIFYSLLRISQEKERPRRWCWIIILSFSLGIIIQLHALTLVGMPIITITYILATRTKIRWKESLAGIFIVFVLISPMIINEKMTNYQGIKSLFSGASGRQDSQKDFSLAKKMAKSTQELSRNYVIMLTSSELVNSLDQTLRKEGAWDMIERNFKGTKNRINLFYSFLAIIFFLLPFVYFIKYYFALKNDTKKRNFIVLVIIWQAILFAMFVEFVFVQHSRYYLAVLPIPFIFLGIYLSILSSSAWRGRILLLVMLILISFNLVQVGKWIGMIENYSSPNQNYAEKGEFILDSYYNVTWGQMKSIDDYLEKYYQENNKEIFLMSPDQFYSRSIRYPLIYEKNIPIRIFSNGIRDKDKQYFSIQLTDFEKKDDNLKIFGSSSKSSFQSDFEVADSKNFGTLTLLSVKIKDTVQNKTAKPDDSRNLEGPDSKKDEPENSSLVKKYTWNSFFTHSHLKK